MNIDDLNSISFLSQGSYMKAKATVIEPGTRKGIGYRFLQILTTTLEVK